MASMGDEQEENIEMWKIKKGSALWLERSFFTTFFFWMRVGESPDDDEMAFFFFFSLSLSLSLSFS